LVLSLHPWNIILFSFQLLPISTSLQHGVCSDHFNNWPSHNRQFPPPRTNSLEHFELVQKILNLSTQLITLPLVIYLKQQGGPVWPSGATQAAYSCKLPKSSGSLAGSRLKSLIIPWFPLYSTYQQYKTCPKSWLAWLI